MNAAATRRTLLRGLLAGLAGRYCVRRSSAALLPETGAAPRALLHGFRSGQAVERRYRADAAVIFCGVTIFSRRDVGGAYASVETGQAGGASATALRSSAHQQVTFARGSASRGSARSWTELIPLSRPCDWKESPDLLAALADEEPRSPAAKFRLGPDRFFLLCEPPRYPNNRPRSGLLYTRESCSRWSSSAVSRTLTKARSTVRRARSSRPSAWTTLPTTAPRGRTCVPFSPRR